MKTPTQLTTAELDRLGWRYAKCEFYDRVGFSADFLGFVDIVAFPPGSTCLAIQLTDRSNASKRVRKILEQCAPLARAWLESHNRIEVWDWRLRDEDLRIQILTLESFSDGTSPMAGRS